MKSTRVLTVYPRLVTFGLLLAALIRGVGSVGGTEAVPASSPATHNLLQNGGFEQPAKISTYSCFSAGRQLQGWTIESGTVDIVGPYWKSAEGIQSLDLNGIFEQIGTIYQDVPTTPGQRYQIRFAFAGNPEGGPVTKTIRISWGAEDLGTLTFDTTGCNFGNMKYRYHQYVVIATGQTTRLRFQSLTPSFCGPVLDDISVSAEAGSAPTLAEQVAAVVRSSRASQSSGPEAAATAPARPVVTKPIAAASAPAQVTPAVLELHLRPVLTIFGTVGRSYRIESASDLAHPEWVARTNLLLETSPCLWVDTETPQTTNCFYRAVLSDE